MPPSCHGGPPSVSPPTPSSWFTSCTPKEGREGKWEGREEDRKVGWKYVEQREETWKEETWEANEESRKDEEWEVRWKMQETEVVKTKSKWEGREKESKWRKEDIHIHIKVFAWDGYIRCLIWTVLHAYTNIFSSTHPFYMHSITAHAGLYNLQSVWADISWLLLLPCGDVMVSACDVTQWLHTAPQNTTWTDIKIV